MGNSLFELEAAIQAFSNAIKDNRDLQLLVTEGVAIQRMWANLSNRYDPDSHFKKAQDMFEKGVLVSLHAGLYNKKRAERNGMVGDQSFQNTPAYLQSMELLCQSLDAIVKELKKVRTL